MSARTFKLIGAAGAAALTVGVMAGPAVAAGEETADVNYTCTTALGLTPAPTAHYAVDAPPATMVAGQTVKLATTGTITLDATTTAGVVGGFGWAKFDASIVTPTTGTTVGQNLTVPKTAMANGAGGTTVAPLSGNTIVRPTAAGTYTLKLGNLGAASGLPAGAVTLNGYSAADAVLNTAVFPDGGSFGQCTNNAGKTALVDSLAAPATVAVTKDKSKTTASAAYNAKKDKATGKAKVKGATYGLAGTGKVKFVLKKGTRTIAKATGKLNAKGIAKHVFSKVKKHGKYKIVASYGGSAGLKGSSDVARFTVK